MGKRELSTLVIFTQDCGCVCVWETGDPESVVEYISIGTKCSLQ